MKEKLKYLLLISTPLMALTEMKDHLKPYQQLY